MMSSAVTSTPFACILATYCLRDLVLLFVCSTPTHVSTREVSARRSYQCEAVTHHKHDPLASSPQSLDGVS